MKIVFVILWITISVQAQEWTPLYNGENLEGWDHVGDGKFIIEEGILKTQGGMGLLWFTGQKFGDVKLRIVYKGADANNAGVFIRIPEKPTEAWMPVNKGYEVQIDDRQDDNHKTGVLYSFTRAKANAGIPGAWNTMEITLKGDRTIVYVNGILVTDFREGDPVPEKVLPYEPDRGPRPKTGYIGIQNHSIEDVIEFREISFSNLEDQK